MTDSSRASSLKTLLIATLGSNAVVVAVVVTMGLRLERAVEAAAASAQAASSAETELGGRLPVRRVQESTSASAVASAPLTPISSEQFRAQWEGHYAATAEAKCWRPHFSSYLKLPGHLDLQFEVSSEGNAERFDLLGYKNPGDAPDPALAKAVFECVSIMLRAAHFPATGSPYSVRGRVNRPSPPPGCCAAAGGNAPPPAGAVSAPAAR